MVRQEKNRRATYGQKVERPKGNYGNPEEGAKAAAEEDEDNRKGSLQDDSAYGSATIRIEYTKGSWELTGAGGRVDDANGCEERP